MRRKLKTSVLVTLLTLLGVAWAGHTFAQAPPVSGEISVWCMGNEGMQIAKMARKFEEDFPGTTVRTQAIPWSGTHDRLITAVAGRVTPDVVQLGTTWVPEFAAIGALEPLESRLRESSRIDQESFFPASFGTTVWKGEVVAIPWYVDTRVVFYRSDIMEAAGWDEYPATWEQWERMAAELTRDLDGDGKTDQFALNLSARDEQQLVSTIWQSGGEIMDESATLCTFDSPETRHGLEFLRSLFKRGFSPGAEAGQIDPYQAFRDGYFVSWMSGPWMVGEYERRLPELKGKWKVALVPGDKTRASFCGGCNLAIFRDSSNKELAWAFVEYLSRPENQLEWFRLTGDLPTVRAAWDAPQFRDSETWRVFRDQLAEARAVPMVECWEPMAEVMKNEMERMLLADQSAETTAQNIQRDLSIILENRRTGTGNLPSSINSLLAGFAIFLLVAGLFVWRAGRREFQGWRRLKAPALFLSPILTHLTVFLAAPILVSFFLSMTDYDIYSVGDWRHTSLVGLQNYGRLLHDPLFWKSVFNTFYFIAVAGPLTIALALGCALFLNSSLTPIKGVFRTGFFLPVVTPIIAISVVWRWIYSPQNGLLNGFLGVFGLSEQTWLADPFWAMPCLIAMAVWKNFGYSMVIFLAGLQAIPKSLYEAAAIDGAGPWGVFSRITFPMLRPTTVFVTIITTIGFMQFFAEPYVMTEMGGPQNSTLSIVLYLYKNGFKFFDLGYASAIAYTLCAGIALLSFVQLRWARAVDE